MSYVSVLDLTKRNNTSSSDYYGVVHSLDAMGIPFTINYELIEAIPNPVIITAGSLKSTTFSEMERDELKEYVSKGGVVIANNLSDRRIYDLFGINQRSVDTTKEAINFDKKSNDDSLKYIDDEKEEKIIFGNERGNTINAVSYGVSTGKSLCYYNDSEIAIVKNEFGKGKTYLLGFRLADTIMLTQTNNGFSAQGESNKYQAGSDAIMLFLKAIYENNVGLPLIKHTIPYGKESAIIITHDVDATNAFETLDAFTTVEKTYDIKSTFFVTTKYVGDKVAKAFYNRENIKILQMLREGGFDIGSHSVGHFHNFEKLDIGSYEVSKEDYNPYYDGFTTYGATVFGEIKVSKELLDKDLNQKTLSFRAGHLLFPDKMANVLEECGYMYDSSSLASDVSTNYPFVLMRDSLINSNESSILEIPLTLSDRYLEETNVEEVVKGWIEVIEANKKNNAITTILIHPTKHDCKIKAEKQLLGRLNQKEYWFDTIEGFGSFWNARFEIAYSVKSSGEKIQVQLNKNKSDIYDGLTLELPAEKSVESVIGRDGSQINFETKARNGKKYIVLSSK